jgi:hypothetical protein
LSFSCVPVIEKNKSLFSKVSGMARMEAVKMGWYVDQKEVVRLPPVENAIKTFLADITKDNDAVVNARTVAWIVPLAAEFLFRTMGHHFLSTDAATFIGKYETIFKSSLLTHLMNL